MEIVRPTVQPYDFLSSQSNFIYLTAMQHIHREVINNFTLLGFLPEGNNNICLSFESSFEIIDVSWMIFRRRTDCRWCNRVYTRRALESRRILSPAREEIGSESDSTYNIHQRGRSRILTWPRAVKRPRSACHRSKIDLRRQNSTSFFPINPADVAKRAWRGK